MIIPVESTNSYENGDYLKSVNRKSSFIFLFFIFSFTILISYTLTRSIEISTGAFALIRSSSELGIIQSQVSGEIAENLIVENQYVSKGQLLCVIDSKILKDRKDYLNTKKRELEQFIEDLDILLNGKNYNDITTSLYKQSYLSFTQKITQAESTLQKHQIDYDRNATLHKEKVIADAEFQNFQYELDKAKSHVELLLQTQFSQWENELYNHKRELIDIEEQLSQLEKELERYLIRAPISGTIQNLTGLYQGSAVFANQEIAHISPDTSLIVEAFISPNDIGFIYVEMPVKYQIDAFDYNYWGLASGKVIDISNDIQVSDDKPVFKVKCSLDTKFLELKNGYKGNLKKGMTLQARFKITDRTIWQLLFDKVDDWLNPNTFIRK